MFSAIFSHQHNGRPTIPRVEVFLVTDQRYLTPTAVFSVHKTGIANIY